MAGADSNSFSCRQPTYDHQGPHSRNISAGRGWDDRQGSPQIPPTQLTAAFMCFCLFCSSGGGTQSLTHARLLALTGADLLSSPHGALNWSPRSGSILSCVSGSQGQEAPDCLAVFAASIVLMDDALMDDVGYRTCHSFI